MSTWMYQFWLFSYKTAKYWGRGPQSWTADILVFYKYFPKGTVPSYLPGTPGMSVSTPASHPTPQEGGTPDSSQKPAVRPSSLCRWSIHCEPIEYRRVPSPPPSLHEQFDVDDEKTWPAWAGHTNATHFTEAITDSIQHNTFSNLEVDTIPVSTNEVASAARRSPEELLKESIGFSIMGRSERLLEDLLEDLL